MAILQFKYRHDISLDENISRYIIWRGNIVFTRKSEYGLAALTLLTAMEQAVDFSFHKRPVETLTYDSANFADEYKVNEPGKVLSDALSNFIVKRNAYLWDKHIYEGIKDI